MCKLNIAQEEACRRYIRWQDAIGIPPNQEMLRILANKLLARAHGDAPGAPPTVGNTWIHNFLGRHADIIRAKVAVQEI